MVCLFEVQQYKNDVPNQKHFSKSLIRRSLACKLGFYKVPYGYMGQILWVDLTKKTTEEETPSEEVYKKYLGGYGLGVYYIYNRLKPNCDPLGPDNILGFCPGLFTGTAAPFTGRYMVCGKSPLTGKGKRADGKECTGGWGDANSGGYFGPAVKRSGYDAIFFIGRADKPVYLLIEEDRIELMNAEDLWGLDSIETESQLKKRHGQTANIACIGVAGEKMSLISGVVNDGGRIAARSGLGAVMGSKNLKALCLRGRKRIELADKKTTIDLSKEYRSVMNGRLSKERLSNMLKVLPKTGNLLRAFNISFGSGINMAMKMPIIEAEDLLSNILGKYGTIMNLPIASVVGDAPIKNHKGIGHKEYPIDVANTKVLKTILNYESKNYGCFGCPLRCGAIIKAPEIGIEEVHKPEYETAAAFGPLILNGDPETIMHVNDYLNREGMDTISAGATIAFVLECVEAGLLDRDDFKCNDHPEGFLPQWNTSEYIIPLLKLMVNREGIGDILADGVDEASKKIEGSSKYAMTANGQEIPMHDARYTEGLAMTYMADPTPGRHTAACMEFMMSGPINHFLDEINLKMPKTTDEMGKGQSLVAKFKQSFNSLGLCEFSAWCGAYPLFKLIKSVFGWDLSFDDLITTGWRIQTLRQMFNGRAGAIRHKIAARAIGDPPMKKGPLKGVSIPLEERIASYYSYMGYDKTGLPLESTLKDLGLDWVIKDLDLATGRLDAFRNRYLESE